MKALLRDDDCGMQHGGTKLVANATFCETLEKLLLLENQKKNRNKYINNSESIAQKNSEQF